MVKCNTELDGTAVTYQRQCGTRMWGRARAHGRVYARACLGSSGWTPRGEAVGGARVCGAACGLEVEVAFPLLHLGGEGELLIIAVRGVGKHPVVHNERAREEGRAPRLASLGTVDLEAAHLATQSSVSSSSR